MNFDGSRGRPRFWLNPELRRFEVCDITDICVNEPDEGCRTVPHLNAFNDLRGLDGNREQEKECDYRSDQSCVHAGVLLHGT
jgi:hypothetical protein